MPQSERTCCLQTCLKKQFEGRIEEKTEKHEQSHIEE